MISYELEVTWRAREASFGSKKKNEEDNHLEKSIKQLHRVQYQTSSLTISTTYYPIKMITNIKWFKSRKTRQERQLDVGKNLMNSHNNRPSELRR